MIHSRSWTIILLGVLLAGVSCTGPSKESELDRLMRILLEIPEVPQPLETEGNAQNEYFLEVKNLVNEIRLPKRTYMYFIREIFDEWEGPYAVNQGYEWYLLDESDEPLVTFRASGRDTVIGTRRRLETPDPYKDWDIEIIPGVGGRYRNSLFWRYKTHEYGIPWARYMIYDGWSRLSIADSTFGGAVLSRSSIAGGYDIAGWDLFGNGWFKDPVIGSRWP